MIYCVHPRKAMAVFLARKAREAEVSVITTDSGDLVIPTKREGKRLATIAQRYGWDLTRNGISWSYQWLGWQESDPHKAAQLAVLRHEIAARYGTDEVYGSEHVSASVIVANPDA